MAHNIPLAKNVTLPLRHPHQNQLKKCTKTCHIMKFYQLNCGHQESQRAYLWAVTESFVSLSISSTISN